MIEQLIRKASIETRNATFEACLLLISEAESLGKAWLMVEQLKTLLAERDQQEEPDVSKNRH